jgi:hypothetical protein
MAEALRLADRLESDFIRSQTMVDAAAELRRLSAVEAQRDALLEALKTYGWHTEDCPQYPTHARPKNWPACTCGFDAAIKAVEEGK